MHYGTHHAVKKANKGIEHKILLSFQRFIYSQTW
jgi:hypothetical protein